jgi:hypothetical protein
MTRTTIARQCCLLAAAILMAGTVAGPARALADDDEFEPAGSGISYFVATNGSDANAGTLNDPWRTIEKGLESLSAGDTLYVRGGTYLERIMSPSISPGRSDDRIRVMAYGGEVPVLKGLLWVTGADYWTFDGLNVTWDPETGSSSEHMVKFTDGVGWKFLDAEVWGARSYAAFLVYSSTPGEPKDWTIARNCIHTTYPTHEENQDHLLYVNGGLSGGGRITRNILFDATYGDGIKLGGSSPGNEDTANVLVRYNTVYDTSQNIRVLWTSHDNVISWNILDMVGQFNYGNVRGYQLSGQGNVASDNWGYDADTFILNDDGYTGIDDGGGNVFPKDPRFDSTASCDGFHPSTAGSDQYGRYGQP